MELKRADGVPPDPSSYISDPRITRSGFTIRCSKLNSGKNVSRLLILRSVHVELEDKKTGRRGQFYWRFPPQVDIKSSHFFVCEHMQVGKKGYLRVRPEQTFRRHSVYSLVNDPYDVMKSGPTRKKIDISAFFFILFSPT